MLAPEALDRLECGHRFRNAADLEAVPVSGDLERRHAPDRLAGLDVVPRLRQAESEDRDIALDEQGAKLFAPRFGGLVWLLTRPEPEREVGVELCERPSELLRDDDRRLEATPDEARIGCCCELTIEALLGEPLHEQRGEAAAERDHVRVLVDQRLLRQVTLEQSLEPAGSHLLLIRIHPRHVFA